MERRSNLKAKIWSIEVIFIKDDTILRQIVGNGESINWKSVSFILKSSFDINRTPKQCRDRWCNYTKFEQFSQKFSKPESKMVFELFFEYGCKWSYIANIISSKSENQIKIFINSTLRRNIRRYNKGKRPDEKIPIFSLKLYDILELREILKAEKKIKSRWLFDKAISDSTKEAIKNIIDEEKIINVGKSNDEERNSELSNEDANPLVMELDYILDQNFISLY